MAEAPRKWAAIVNFGFGLRFIGDVEELPQNRTSSQRLFENGIVAGA
jgi:hypothetical protein